MAAAKLLALVLFAATNSAEHSHKPAHAGVDYVIRIAAGDTSGFEVEMRVQNAPDTFLVAMAAHPEYDERFWRYVEHPRVIGMKLGASIVRQDSALWRVAS